MGDRLFLLTRLAISLSLIFLVTACGSTPRLMAQERLFLDLSLEFIGEYQLPKTSFEDTTVGGLSAISYDRQKSLFYVLSDDRSRLAPARFYTLNIEITDQIDNIEIEKVTFLTNQQGETFPPDSLDPEGLAITPRHTLFISSEGISDQEIPAFIDEFNLETGKLETSLRIPQRYFPSETGGIKNNLGFEALTVTPGGLIPDDPFRLFTATESALLQDSLETKPDNQNRIRLMHYTINSIGDPVLVAEHLYLLEPSNNDTISNGLTELIALEKEGYLLSLERCFGLSGFGAKIFQVVVANGTDTSRIESLKGDISKVEPIQKKLILDLAELPIELDNLEGMTMGPRLADGSQTLLLVSDDNFRNQQVNQFLLFRLQEK